MKKYYVTFANIFMVFMISASFLIAQRFQANLNKEMAKDYAKNYIMLSSSNVVTHIEDYVEQMRVVGQMMANDVFLETWMENEDDGGQHTRAIYDYLRTYKELNGYDVLFFVSSESGVGYYSDGRSKSIAGDADWYTQFMEKDVDVMFDFGTDVDSTGNEIIALFVDCIVRDDDENILGVIGAGMYIDNIVDIVNEYDETIDSDAYIVDLNDDVFTSSYSIFKTVPECAAILGISESDITDNATSSATYIEHDDDMIILRYILSINVMVATKKNVASLANELSYSAQESVYLLTLLMIPVIIVFVILLRAIERRIVSFQNTDELTCTCNNRLFKQRFNKAMRRDYKISKSLVMLDIDNFKKYNDTMGHLYGNTVLQFIAAELKQRAGDKGIVGRWGGDEFIVYLPMTPVDAQKIMDECNVFFQNNDANIRASISIGIIEAENGKTLEKLVKHADEALYMSKENGKARSTIL